MFCARGDKVPGNPARRLSTADTSFYRTNVIEALHLLCGWRACTNGPERATRSDAFHAWCNTTRVVFRHGHKVMVQDTLARLLDGGVYTSPVRTPGVVDVSHVGCPFVQLYELYMNDAFGLEVECYDHTALDALRITCAHLGVVLSIRVTIAALRQL